MGLPIAREKASSDAFFDIAKLTADGTLDIDVFFGWDYHDNFHIKHGQDYLITTTSFSNAATPATVEDFTTALLAHDSRGRAPADRAVAAHEARLQRVRGRVPHDVWPARDRQRSEAAPVREQGGIRHDLLGERRLRRPGNPCVKMGASGKRCTAACTADEARCKSVASSSTSTIYGKACAK